MKQTEMTLKIIVTPEAASVKILTIHQRTDGPHETVPCSQYVKPARKFDISKFPNLFPEAKTPAPVKSFEELKAEALAKLDAYIMAEAKKEACKKMKQIDELKEQVLSNEATQIRYKWIRFFVNHLLCERGVSPDLIDRIALGMCENIPGLRFDVLFEMRSEAEMDKRRGHLKYRWIRILNYARRCFENAGYEWTPCRTAKQVEVEIPVKTKRKPPGKEGT